MQNDYLAKLFSSGAFVKQAYTQLQHLIDLLTHKNPTMRILEVGAGTGGATSAVLYTLVAGSSFRRFEKYVFTDSAAWCVSDAKAKLGEYGSALDFQTLDVLQDPVSQGFEEHSFDLVIAAGCLTQLGSAEKGLEHLHRLLKPTGSLILVERTGSTTAAELLSRTLSGKWHQEDVTYYSTTQWDDVLLRSRFSGVSISLQDVSIDLSYY